MLARPLQLPFGPFCSGVLLSGFLVAAQGHPPPEEELELGYGDEQDAMVEYVNDGYDQDLLDEEGFEGEEYPEVLEGEPATCANLLGKVS